MGLALLSLQRLDSAAVGGLLVAALLIPHLLTAPLVGLVIDRSRAPRMPGGRRGRRGVFGAALLSTAALAWAGTDSSPL